MTLRLTTRRLALAAAGLMLACSAASANPFNALYAVPNPFIGVYGPRGNDTGGIIPWSPENERNAYAIAEANCGWYNKYPVPSTIHRVHGDYIAYRCVWDPPRMRPGRLRVKVDK